MEYQESGQKKTGCRHVSVCSGCGGVQNGLVAAAFFDQLGVPGYKIISGSLTEWRTRAKLAVRQQGKSGLVVGLFACGSHTVVFIPDCVAHHPHINKAVDLFLQWFKTIPGYNEVSGQGILRYIQLCVERRSGRVQLTIVLNRQSIEVERLARLLYESAPAFWHSIWINLQPVSTNTIFGREWKRIVGSPLVWEELCGIQIPFSAQHFGQANLEMFERLLEDLIDLLPQNAKVVELFSGMGVISLVLSPHVFSVKAVEREVFAQSCFDEGKERLPYPLQERVTFEVADAMTSSEVLVGMDTLIVDPPRRGLSSQLVKRICDTDGLDTVLYISCQYESFERDAKLLMQNGFQILFARSYLFFPGTGKIETLAMFQKEGSG